VAVVASARDAKESLLEAHLTVAIARRACGWARPLLRSASAALGTGFMPRNFDPGRCSKCGLFEAQFEIVSEIGAPLNTASPARSPAKEIAKTEDVAENIAEVRKYAWIETTESASGRRSDTRMAETVILPTLLRIA